VQNGSLRFSAETKRCVAGFSGKLWGPHPISRRDKPQYGAVLNQPPTILLAEDSEDDVILIERAFRKAGIRSALFAVRDGEEAISYLTGFGRFADRVQFPFPDLFLLDLKLPMRDGFGVLRWMQEQPDLKKLPVIVLTQSDRIKDANEAYRLGAYSFLVKGTDFAETAAFAQSVGEYLAKAKNNGGPHLPPAAWPHTENMAPGSDSPNYPQPSELPQLKSQ
jgi:CheY-like chemotaxis protein